MHVTGPEYITSRRRGGASKQTSDRGGDFCGQFLDMVEKSCNSACNSEWLKEEAAELHTILSSSPQSPLFPIMPKDFMDLNYDQQLTRDYFIYLFCGFITHLSTPERGT